MLGRERLVWIGAGLSRTSYGWSRDMQEALLSLLVLQH